MTSSFWRVRAALWVTIMTGTLTGQTLVDLRTQSRNVDFSGASATRPVKTGGALPAACITGEVFFNTAAVAGSNMYLCTATNTWSQINSNGAAATAIATTTISLLPSSCAVGEFRYITDASFSAGGWPLYQCTALNTWTQVAFQADGTGYFTVSCNTPANCQIGANTAVLPALPGVNAWTGANDFSAASKTAMFRLASPAPSTCDSTKRETYFNTSVNALSVCTSADTWTTIGGILLYKKIGLATVTANGSLQTLDSFIIPAGTLQVGDILEIEIDFRRTGSAGPITFGVTFGSSTFPSCCVSTPVASSAAVYRLTLAVTGTSAQSWGGLALSSTMYPVAPNASAATNNIASPITVSVTQNGSSPDTGSVVSWFIKVTR